MQNTRVSYLTASVALVGAGLIAAAPVAGTAVPQTQLPDVALTAGSELGALDFTGAWQSVFDTAKTNITEIGDTFTKAPLASLQQSIADPIELIKGLSDGAIKPGDLFDHLQDQATNLFQDTTLIGGTLDADGNVSEATAHANDAFHSIIVAVLPALLAEGGADAQTVSAITDVLGVLASPAGGLLIGALGPMISPLVELGNTVGDISGALTGDTPDPTAALQALIDLPANLVGAELNGATLNLDALVPLIADSGLMPEGMSVDSLSFAFGGLLSPGGTALELGGADMGGDTGIGGSILNSLGLNALGLPIDGEPLGPLAALVNFDQIVAGALGWDGVGDPLGDIFTGLDL